jgi:uncharacterized protein HemX
VQRGDAVDVFVVLALALAVLAVGTVVVAVVVLRRQVKALSAALRQSSERIETLARELGEESAVLSLETEALQRRITEGRTRAADRYTAEDRRLSAGS